LTTPIIRCLKDQLDVDIDFLTKDRYQDLIIPNPNIRDVITLDSMSKTIALLKFREYDFVIDLQNSFRSFIIRSVLAAKSFSFSKYNFRRYLLIYCGINLLNNHIVDRYFTSVDKLNIYNDNKGINYFFASKKYKIDFNTKQEYVCWCIGGTYENKRLSAMQIINVISQIDIPVLLIGSKSEKKISSKIVNSIHCDNVFDLCGETSIDESAYLMKKSKIVLTNDTGMMHIASAFDIPIISFWGCTKPELGFYAYQSNIKSQNITTSISVKPCSKHGKSCRFTKKGCIKQIDEDLIVTTVKTLLK
jgi:ADP-heptose:LPS heptosyltransferase